MSCFTYIHGLRAGRTEAHGPAAIATLLAMVDFFASTEKIAIFLGRDLRMGPLFDVCLRLQTPR